MAATNARLHGPALVTNAATTKYTAPAGSIAVLQHIHVSNPSASGVTFTMSIGASAAATRIYDAYTIGAGQVLDVFCKYVLAAGESIQALAGTTNVLTLTLDGQVNSATPAGSANEYGSIYEVDFTLLPTQTMQAAGSYVIDGKTWWAKGPVKNAGATYGLVLGSGLRVSLPASVSPPFTSLDWRSSGDTQWDDRIFALPMSQIPNYNPLAPLAVLWRATGTASAGAGEAALYAGLGDAAASAAALTGPERATSVTVGYLGDASNCYVLCSPYANDPPNSQWQFAYEAPPISPAGNLDQAELGMMRFAAKRFYPMAKHFSLALGNPNTANEFSLAGNNTEVRSGNGQSNTPCFFFVAPMPFNGARTFNMTNLKIMQPKSV